MDSVEMRSEKNRIGKRRWISLMACLVMACLLCMLCGCQEQVTQNKGRTVQGYFINSAETKLEIHEFEKPTGSTEDQIRTMISYLSAIPENLAYKSPLAMGFSVIEAEYKEKSVALNVDKNYLSLSSTTEVLVRAAIVRTLLQAENVNRVQILVEGAQLTDGAGDTVGWMTADQFIYNDGSEINSYDQVRVKLYFANETGDHLIAAYREKFYSTNVSMERFVVDEILSGPSGKIAGLYPTVSPDTKILSVMTKDGICYVNFDGNFLTVVGNVTTEVAIYSIVNSLIELPSVNRVQILVNGEIPESFSETTFDKNMEIVTTVQ